MKIWPKLTLTVFNNLSVLTNFEKSQESRPSYPNTKLFPKFIVESTL